MIEDKNRIYDGFQTLESGVDGGRAPNLIDVNQVASAENMVFRGGRAKTRPGIRNYPLTVSNGSNTVGGQTATDAFFGGMFQSACYYAPPNGTQCIMVMSAGRLFQVTPLENTVIVAEIIMSPVNNATYTNYMIQADKFLIVQDAQSPPIIFDGATARRSNIVSHEVPVGTLMAYGMGRLVVVRPDFSSIVFGDLYGSHADKSDPGDSIILFTETTFLTEGFDARIPFDLGKATAATFFPQLDTSTGNGQLMVFCERGAASFFLSLDRSQWKTAAFQQLALLTTGLRGWRSISAVNEDLWFRSEDGWRSYRQARSEPLGWAHIPLSTNVHQYLDNDTPSLLYLINSIYFDNRIIATCNPYWNNGRPYHNGMVVVDFDILSSFGTKFRPAWNGRWTGIKITQLVVGIFKGVRRAFAFGIDNNSKNALYEISLSDKDDFNDTEIDWELVTRAFDFGKLYQSSSPFNENELYDADVWFSDVVDTQTQMNFYYKPDNYPQWVQWQIFSNRAKLIGTPSTITSGGVPIATAGFAPRLSLGKPPDDYDPTNTSRLLRRGYEFQMKLTGSGHLQIDRLRVHGQRTVERSRGLELQKGI
jgi:hypothetical protein